MCVYVWVQDTTTARVIAAFSENEWVRYFSCTKTKISNKQENDVYVYYCNIVTIRNIIKKQLPKWLIHMEDLNAFLQIDVSRRARL